MSVKLYNKNKKTNIFAKLLKEPTPKKIINDPVKIKKMYGILQPTIFIVMYLMYFISYLGRKSLCVGFNGPQGARALLGLPCRTYGILGMIYYAAYMSGKFLGGIIADRSNVRVTLPLAIGTSSIFSAGIAVAGYLSSASILSTTNSITMFMYITWGIAAFIQSLTFPMCAKELVYWYSNKNRAYIWAWWSTSHEIGSACSLLVSGLLLQYTDWKAVFVVPALLGVSISIVAVFLLRDKPSTLGLPDVETFVGNNLNEKTDEITPVSEDENNVDDRSYWEVFKTDVLKNKVLWILSLTYISVYILRAGTVDWIPKMFMESANISPVMAALPVVILSICGTLGTLSIPFVSEKIFKGRRAPALVCYFLLVTICLVIFRLIFAFDGTAIINVPEPFKTILMFVLMGLSGIGIYGPQMMVGGIAAIETGSKRVSATISGITGSIGYVGSIISSFFGVFAHHWGYQFLNNAWIVSGIIGTLLMISIWDVKADKDYSH